MAFVDEFRDLMPHTVTLAPVESYDAYGKPTHGVAVSYTARVRYKQQRVGSARVQGQEVMASGDVILAGTPTPNVDDKLTLPGDIVVDIVNWERVADEGGWAYTKIYFG
jgi:hypothetical protein